MMPLESTMKHFGLARRGVLLAGIVLLAGSRLAVAAEAPRSVAVLSLIGDEMSLVTRRTATGSNLDRNDRQAIALTDPSIDLAASLAAERAIREAMPGVERLRVTVSDKRLYALQDAVFERGPQSDPMREALQAMLQGAKATHLVLITKRRDDARFALHDTHIGNGKIAGIGIFVDNVVGLEDRDTRIYGNGYFATYAYLQATLVEVATMRVLGRGIGKESMMTTAIGASAAVAWDMLPAAGKAENLMRVADLAAYRATRDSIAAR
jgi:hypothetical protein